MMGERVLDDHKVLYSLHQFIFIMLYGFLCATCVYAYLIQRASNIHIAQIARISQRKSCIFYAVFRFIDCRYIR